MTASLRLRTKSQPSSSHAARLQCADQARILIRANKAADPKETGRALNVRYLLIGTVRREGETVHANVRIIEANSGRQVWAEPFSYVRGEAGAQQRTVAQIARLATEGLLISESKPPLPSQPVADPYAILGRAAMNGKGSATTTLEAMGLFEKAPSSTKTRAPLPDLPERGFRHRERGGRAISALWLDQAESAIASMI